MRCEENHVSREFPSHFYRLIDRLHHFLANSRKLSSTTGRPIHACDHYDLIQRGMERPLKIHLKRAEFFLGSIVQFVPKIRYLVETQGTRMYSDVKSLIGARNVEDSPDKINCRGQNSSWTRLFSIRVADNTHRLWNGPWLRALSGLRAIHYSVHEHGLQSRKVHQPVWALSFVR